MESDTQDKEFLNLYGSEQFGSDLNHKFKEKIKMREINKISEKKQKQLDKLEKSPIKVGDKIWVYENKIESYSNNKKRTVLCVVKDIKVDDDTKEKMYKLEREDNSVHRDKLKWLGRDAISSRYNSFVGANPFDADINRVRSVNYALESILFNLNVLGERESMDKYQMNGHPVLDLNWNPFVYINGKKKYYQRDFCWTLEQKQNLIHSLYLGIDIGKIVVRKREWSEVQKLADAGETELAFNDIVDGKQRLEALRGFLMGEYTDRDGNYFADLSFYSQNKFTNNQQLGFSEMDEADDKQVLKQFLKMNFEGVPQSKEHLEYVKSLI